MVRIHSSWLLPVALLAAFSAAHAQSTPSAPRAGKADPLNPQASVPPLVYESAFARYRRHADEKPTDWKEANDTVARIGGWRAYVREASQPEAPGPATPPVPAKPAEAAERAKPMPSGHGMHKSN